MTIGAFIKELREKKGYTQRQLAYLAGVSNTEISRIEKGERKQPNPDVLRKLARPLGVDYEILAEKAGYLSREEVMEKRVQEFLEREAIPLVPLPILGTIHAGDPIPAEENIEGWTAIPEHMAKGGKHFALRVRGDCFSAGVRPIYEGDVVIVRQQPIVNDGEIAVVVWPDVGEAQLRRVYRQNGMVVLRADNPAYPPEIVQKRDLKILGLVVGIQGVPAAAKE